MLSSKSLASSPARPAPTGIERARSNSLASSDAAASSSVLEFVPSLEGSPGRLVSQVAGFHSMRFVGSSDHSVVFSAVHIDSRQKVALKLFKWGHISGNSDHPSRDRRSAEPAHPGIAETFLHGLAGSHSFVARELVRGQSLRNVLEQVGGLSVCEWIDLSLQVVEILEISHAKRTAHGNLAATNVFLEPCGSIKLTDWNQHPGPSPDSGSGNGDVVTTFEGLALQDLHRLSALLSDISLRRPHADAPEGELDVNAQQLDEVRWFVMRLGQATVSNGQLGRLHEALISMLERRRSRRRAALSRLSKTLRVGEDPNA